MTTTYRQGPVGALMDEYERAAGELARILEAISDEDYTLIQAKGNARVYVRDTGRAVEPVGTGGQLVADTLGLGAGV